MNAGYLTKRGKRFHVRLRVPSDLVALFGRIEVHRSLSVSDGRIARAVARTIRAKTDEAFALIRQQRMLGATDHELQEAARTLYAQVLPATRTAVIARIAYGIDPRPAGDNNVRAKAEFRDFISRPRFGSRAPLGSTRDDELSEHWLSVSRIVCSWAKQARGADQP